VAAKTQRQKIAVRGCLVNDPLTKITNLPFFLKDFDKVRSMPRLHFAAFLPST
jgi:hypothetical protein